MKSLISYRPDYTDLFDGVDRLFGSLVGDGSWMKHPAVDIREEEGRYVLEAELTGLTENDFDVQVHDNLLTISSKKAESEETNKNGYVLRERRAASFSRSFVLPKDVDREKIDAQFKNGLLTLVLNKTPEAKPRSIQIKSN
jgi:HSP20 family protein